ncbi:MAG TPA: hypothetical protein VMF57_10665 [Solirubrobacteraceae bacterium]|nr:hypothetical protein [Solirubrobacteraceae bacterium]
MHEYAIDNRRIMRQAYVGLGAGDLSAFVKPLAPGIVHRVLQEILHPFPGEWVELRIDPEEFSVTPGRVIVSGRCAATRPADQADLRASFRHEWHLTYGVAWRFSQVLPPRPH